MKSNKRVSILIPNFKTGGAEKITLKLAHGLKSLGYECEIVCFNDEGNLKKLVDGVVQVNNLNSQRALTSIIPLIRYIKEKKPAIVISTLTHVNIIAILSKILLKNNIKLIVTEHTVIRSMFLSKSFKDRIVAKLIKFLYPKADYIIAVSEGVKKELEILIRDKEKVITIYNPVIDKNIEKLILEPIDEAKFRNKKEKYIIAVGRLEKVKRFDDLIKAFNILSKKIEAKLWIIGDGNERPNLEKLIKELYLEDKVRLLGFKENPFPYLKMADVFVMSSEFEALPTALIEALYCGIPVVSTDCPFGPREILKNGEYGLLVPVGDIEKLADAMVQILLNNIVQKKYPDTNLFREETCVQKYAQLIERLID